MSAQINFYATKLEDHENVLRFIGAIIDSKNCECPRLLSVLHLYTYSLLLSLQQRSSNALGVVKLSITHSRLPSIEHYELDIYSLPLLTANGASRAEDPGFESHLRRDFFGVESYQ